MDWFQNNGHLTDQALLALIRQEPLEELTRLEIAEHLAFCDQCLQRYMALLDHAPLETPAHSCQDTLWRRIRANSLRLLTSRYATAAAAVTLALTMLWGGLTLPEDTALRAQWQQTGSSISARLDAWPGQVGDSLDGVFSDLHQFFDDFGGKSAANTQGGNNS